MSAPVSFHSGRVVLHAGDCLDVLDAMAAGSVDAVVTDPPYHLTSIVKRFGGRNAAPCRPGTDGLYARASRGFMGKEWDGGDIAFRVETWAKVLRVLKPGGHLVAFSAPKCSHRMVCAIEDAGFEIRDGLMWMFGSGFPKSHDVSKGIDKAAGAKREKIAVGAPVRRMIPGADQDATGSWTKDNGREYQPGVELPVTDAPREWEGWGTALKPAYEPICLARKPLGEKTVAANMLAHGTGAIHVDACRVEATDENPSIARRQGAVNHLSDKPAREMEAQGRMASRQSPEAFRASRAGKALGRFPANVVHDGSAEVVAAFPETGAASASARGGSNPNPMDWGNRRSDGGLVKGHDDAGGSAARFFYSAKADSRDRLGSKHPTVKPVDLMRWLCRLVTPPGGVILDLFAGTGTTGEAALLENFSAVLIEREAEYRADIARRMAHVFDGANGRRNAIAKAKGAESHDSLPLFGGVEDRDKPGHDRVVLGDASEEV